MHQEMMVTNDNIELSQLEDKTAIDNMASEFSTSFDTMESPKSFNTATSMWRASTSSRVGISKEKGDWRKKNPHNPPHEWRCRFFSVNKNHARTIVAVTITSMPLILLPSSSLNMELKQGLIWTVITAVVLQQETSTGSLLKAAARILGTVLGAIIGGLGGVVCSRIVNISFFTRIVCVLAMLLLVSFSYWIRIRITYFRNNDYAALILVLTTIIVYLSTIRGDLYVALVRVIGIMVGVIVSLFCTLCVMPVSAERCLNELLVNSLMDVNELVNMVISMAKLRHVNANAAPEVSGSATDDLNDGNRIHEHDAEITLSDEYDYRTDAAHAFATNAMSKTVSRGDALLGIAVHEHNAVWGERKLRWRSTPSEKFALLLKDLRRILYIIVQFHPYIHIDVLSRDWDSDLIQHVEACLNIIMIVLDYVIEARLSVWSSSSAPIPFKTLLSMLTEGLKHHFWFSATEVLKRSQPLEDSARTLLDYYALHNDTPHQFVSEDYSERAYREWAKSFNTSHSTTTAVSAHPDDINPSASARDDTHMVDVAFQKHVMMLHCHELIFRAYVRTMQMLRTLSQLQDEEMLCN